MAENNLMQLRKSAGWSRPQLAERMGTSAQQIEKLEKGMRRLTLDWIERFAAAFEISPAAIISGESPPPNAKPVLLEGPSAERMHEDLPIYGTALGAPKMIDGEAVEQTHLNQGDVVGYAKRPVILNGRADAYALYVVGQSMAPKYDEGEIILAETKRPARIGDNVVVYLRARGDDDDGQRARAALVKRLVRKTAAYIELEQYTPPITFRISIDEITRIDRVMSLSDLLG
ncbi:Phage repressor protein C, contains Cro/C1-type HTH and peptisase s24 domains [Sphingomonas sp. YR710]|uniref:XRE family transcriptional regulator n=1 Tax=Sphingomonas sp. YR710 TaxID=1882773 RepID=UPI0008848CB9|nr:XRE family transcriptional regulator [Sphingomonas sp. YR710]SDC29965.1 Phage repressor protein C, contains Cro/C1-type HTH and peptisase s24 domains [Sphingomonas sp. YR710]